MAFQTTQTTFFDQAIETMPRERLRELQLEKLQQMLRRIIGPNRFYRAKLAAAGVAPDDIRSLEDLQKLPLTTKLELIQAQEEDPPFGTNATFPETAYVRMHQTSGTTGAPLRVVDTEESWQWWARCWAYVLSGAGLTNRDRIFFPFSFGLFVGFWSAVGGARKIGAMMIPGGGSNSLQRLHIMRDIGATAMCCTPTYALRLAEVARENNFDLSAIPMRRTIHAGEPGANVPATKARIERTWNAKCFDHAGASEIGAHCFECEAQPGGTHVIESEYIVEVRDPVTGEAAAPGETGELIITNLGRIGFPVIRYRSGDLVRLDTSPCVCGRTFARFEGGVIGRADDMVIVRGVNIYPSAVENLVRRFQEVDEFKITVISHRAMSELLVEVELIDGADEDTACGAITREFMNTLGMRPMVRAVPRSTLPRFEMKAKRFHKS